MRKPKRCSTVNALPVLLLAACASDAGTAGSKATPAVAATPGADAMESLFVMRVPASSVPVVAQQAKPATPPPPAASMNAAPPPAPAMAGPAAAPGVPPAAPGVPAAPGAPPAAPGAPAAPGGAPAAPAMTETAATIPPAMGGEPTLPEVMGECPEFKDGTTIMVAGHKSIVIRAGAPGKGGPVVFYWHGTGSSAAESGMFPGTSEIVSAGGIVAAYNGSQSSGAGMDCSGTGAHNMADFNASDQIVACGKKNHGIDSRRIYSTGCSAGGLQSGCMAMVRSSYVAAVAPNSGGVTFALPWQDAHTPAVFTMHGAAGTDVVIVDFSNTSQSFDMSSKQHGSFVVNCNHMGGHCGAPGDLQRAAWQFMKDHPWNTPSPWMSGIPAGVPSYCKIF